MGKDFLPLFPTLIYEGILLYHYTIMACKLCDCGKIYSYEGEGYSRKEAMKMRTCFPILF